MAFVHETSEERGWFSRVLTTDFCPWANRFVYWLKEPVGWFVLATMASVFIGQYFAPIGWTMAASLAAMIAVGMLWPWVAVRSVDCALRPEIGCVHEDDPCHMTLSVRNRLPLPVWGLAVEGFLDRKSDEVGSIGAPTVALAYVRGFSTCTYRFSIHPVLRGVYPDTEVSLTCSFPFGIWTARRTLNHIATVTVWPKVFQISGHNSAAGRSRTDFGEGNRAGRSGDFVGVREFRRGDSAKHVNWVASARTDSLVVTERSGPQCPCFEVIVDPSGGASRDEIADRIRVAASLVTNLHQSDFPMRVHIGNRMIRPRQGRDGFVQMMHALTDVPAEGDDSVRMPDPPQGSTSIVISSSEVGDPLVRLVDPAANHRVRSECSRIERLIDAKSLATQMFDFWTEVRDANLVA